jgi:hypothetical protein
MLMLTGEKGRAGLRVAEHLANLTLTTDFATGLLKTKPIFLRLNDFGGRRC